MRESNAGRRCPRDYGQTLRTANAVGRQSKCDSQAEQSGPSCGCGREGACGPETARRGQCRRNRTTTTPGRHAGMGSTAAATTAVCVCGFPRIQSARSKSWQSYPRARRCAVADYARVREFRRGGRRVRTTRRASRRSHPRAAGASTERCASSHAWCRARGPTAPSCARWRWS